MTNGKMEKLHEPFSLSATFRRLRTFSFGLLISVLVFIPFGVILFSSYSVLICISVQLPMHKKAIIFVLVFDHENNSL